MYKFLAKNLEDFRKVESVLLICNFRWRDQVEKLGYTHFGHEPLGTADQLAFPVYIHIKDGVIEHTHEQSVYAASESKEVAIENLIEIIQECQKKNQATNKYSERYRSILQQVSQDRILLEQAIAKATKLPASWEGLSKEQIEIEKAKYSETQTEKAIKSNFNLAINALAALRACFAFPHESNHASALDVILGDEPCRSVKDIVEQTNEMARQFYAEMGYAETRPEFRFWESSHPQELLMWRYACMAQLELTDTDPDELLAEYEDEIENGGEIKVALPKGSSYPSYLNNL